METVHTPQKHDLGILHNIKDKHDSVGIKKYLLVIIALIFIYNLIDTYFTRINNRLTIIDNKLDITLEASTTYRKNVTVLMDTSCVSCHLKPGMLLPKIKMDRKDFISYVRGEKRFISNSRMPNYTNKMISDAKLEEIWNGIY